MFLLQEDNIETGDAIFFSSNTPSSFLLRTFTSTLWNHSGIAIRLLKNSDGKYDRISIDKSGDLFVYETNVGKRYDPINDTEIVGAGYSSWDWVKNKYNLIRVRKLKTLFRTSALSVLTREFTDKHSGLQFPKTALPFISAWLGVDLNTKDSDATNMFCSELMAHYYEYVLGNQFLKLFGRPYQGDLSELFGSKSPEYQSLFKPSDFSYGTTPDAPIFEENDHLVCRESGDLIYVVFQPFIIIIFIAILIYMILPKK